ncbi:MAG: P1 family peptidase [Anaerolineales bacterium]|nr:P1 family peptidase [Anaerolineales bacterium]
MGITAVPSIQVGHATDLVGLTGCTVVRCDRGAVGGIDQRGGSPGTRETDLLRPMHQVQQVHAILLAGGSAFGLAAADGVMRYLEEQGVGFETGVARVPIVPAAILFDLGLGDAAARPTAEMGYAACQAASDGAVAEGNVGAGTGATAGKMLGLAQAMKSGLGTAAVCLSNGLVVGALVAANPLGDIVNPHTGAILAGTRMPGTTEPADTLALLGRWTGAAPAADGRNTVIGVVATNGLLNKEQTNKVAQMAQDGVARAVRPAHTMFDGDTIFALATGEVEADATVVGAYAAEVMAEALMRAALTAEGAGGLPAHCDLWGGGDSACSGRK